MGRGATPEAMPFADNSFDVVMSCVGAMFAPHHQATADELIRVVRPGGTIGMINWTPEGFIGKLFATMKPYAPPPLAGPARPPLWGDEDHVRRLFGERVTGLTTRRQTVRMDHCATPTGIPRVLEAQLRADHRGLPVQRGPPGLRRGPGSGLSELPLAALESGRPDMCRLQRQYLLVTATKT